jgi:hypothetical protein
MVFPEGKLTYARVPEQCAHILQVALAVSFPVSRPGENR